VTLVRALLLVLVATGPVAAAPAAPPAPWLLDQVTTLAAPEMEGRASGSPGAERAAPRSTWSTWTAPVSSE